MCPTDTRNTSNRFESATRSRTRDTLKAIDDPPQVLNRSVGIVSVRNQTPQHVSTLVAPTSSSSIAEPLIVRNKCFVWGLAEGKIGIWSYHQFSAPGRPATRMASLPPAFILETSAITPWIQISEVDTDNNSPEIVCLTSGGTLFHVKINFIPALKAEIFRTWHTKQSGTSCFCITKSNHTFIGYLNGHIEAWRGEILLWKGHFDSYSCIRSMTEVYLNRDDASSGTGSRHEFIALTLEPNEKTATASMVEIIKVSDGMANSNSEAVALEDLWVLPEAGREIMDAASLIVSHRQERSRSFSNHWIPSHGTNMVTSVRDGKGHLWVEIADGSVVFLDAVAAGDELLWGVKERTRGQYLMSFPSIGRGVVTLEGKHHAVCALRGGSVYMFPLAATAPNGTIRSCHYPDDISTDTSMQHLQSFVAGDVFLHVSDDGEVVYPLLFFCWPGGIVDVYCAHLLPSNAGMSDLGALIENGAAEDLCCLLRAIHDDPDHRDTIFADPLWTKAFDEIQARPKKDTRLTLKDAESDRLVHFRKLLRRLADPTLDFAVED